MAVSPWSVKGVDPEAREAAKLAARKSGITVGAWLSQTIRAAANKELKHDAVPTAPGVSPPHRAFDPSAPPDADAAHEHDREVPSEAGHAPPAPTIQAIFENLQNLAERIEAAESKSMEAVLPIEQKVGELAARLENVRSNSDAPIGPVERAVMRIAERLEKLEENFDRDHGGGRKGLFGSRRR